MPDPDHAPDLDVTVRVAAPTPTHATRDLPDVPLPEELAKLLPGENYTVEGFIGQGGMGAVYKGTQVRLQRKVAIKIMRRDRAKDQGFEERFRREALAMAQLNHPNIVNVIDYGEAGPDYLYIVMEFIDGTDLVNVIRSGQMTQEMALRLLPQICDALQFAHDNGIVHRDIKPANILLTRDGRIKMADFGLAKRFDAENSYRTQSGYGMGTPDYAAPEQFMGDAQVDHRADIYALGVMIYQMVTGTLPRGAWKPPSEKAAVDAYWDHIVARALQTDPHDRYASVSEIKTDLGGITSVTGAPRLAPDGTQSLQTAGMTVAKGSTTALTQAGGRPASKVRPLVAPSDAQHTKSSRAPLLIAASLILLAVGGWFGWWKFKPATAASTNATGTLTIRSITPSSPARLTVGEKMKVGIDFHNPGARVVQIWAYPYKYGALSNLVTSSGSFPTDKQSGTVERWFSFKDAGEADELRVEMVANAETVSSREVIAKIAIPISAVWTVTGIPTVSSAPLTDITATKDAPFVNTLGMKFVPVPITGGPTDGKRVLFSIWETQVQDYDVFANETKRTWMKPPFDQGPTHPAVNVNWVDAVAFCTWLTGRERTAGRLGVQQAYRLPSDHEWSCAAGIGGREDAASPPHQKSRNLADVFLWGSEWPPPPGAGNFHGEEMVGSLFFQTQGILNGYWDGFVRTSPAGTFPPNSLGIFDLNGNVSEYCEDWYDATQKSRVARGASWGKNLRNELLVAFRDKHPPNFQNISLGFRCVLEPSPSAAAVSPAPSPQLSSSSVATATKDAPFVNTLGMKLVPVPITGGPTDGRRVLFSVWETRVQDYEAFVKDTKREWAAAGFHQEVTHSAVNMIWDDASAFCAWLTERERKAGKLNASSRYRLPTDHEWSCAVGIGPQEDATKSPAQKDRALAGLYPWGTAWPPPPNVGNYAGEEMIPAKVPGRHEHASPCMGYRDAYVETAPAGSFPANALGLHDLGGSVWEWCEDWYDDSKAEHVLRGCAYIAGDQGRMLSSARNPYRPTAARSIYFGFRIVLEAK